MIENVRILNGIKLESYLFERIYSSSSNKQSTRKKLDPLFINALASKNFSE